MLRKQYYGFVLLLFFAGCTMLVDTRPNFRTFVKGQIKIHAEIKHGEPTKYLYAEIGYPRDKNIDLAKLSGIIIELPDGKVPLSKLTPDMLFAQNCFLAPMEPDGELASFSEGEAIFRIQICKGNSKYSFLTTKKKILKIRIAANAPLWDENLTKQYSFPMDYNEVVELFGEPDGVYDWFTW